MREQTEPNNSYNTTRVLNIHLFIALHHLPSIALLPVKHFYWSYRKQQKAPVNRNRKWKPERNARAGNDISRRTDELWQNPGDILFCKVSAESLKLKRSNSEAKIHSSVSVRDGAWVWMLTVQPLDPPVRSKRTVRIGHISREYVICSTYMSLDKSHNRAEFFLKI